MFNIRYLRFYLVIISIGPLIFTHAYYYCDKQDKLCGDKKHFMCNPDDVPKVGEVLGLLPLTGSIKRHYVDRHNEYRNRLAGGEQEFGGGGKFPKATRMREVMWDDELAYLARIHAKRCNTHLDACHATERFPDSGQNVYEFGAKVKPQTGISSVLRAVEAWWSENTYIEDGNAMVDEYPKGTSKLELSSQFTAMANERAAFVGCGLALCKNCDGNPYCVIVTCNYSLTNVNGTFMYKKGNSSASECDHYESVPSSRYAHLCKNTGKFFKD